MIENLSSKIDFLSDKTPPTSSAKTVEPDLTETGQSSQREDIYELPHCQGQHSHGLSKFPQELLWQWCHEVSMQCHGTVHAL